MNLYRSGSDSVSWHSDDDYPHGGHPAVASLSLGETRRFRIAHKRHTGERHAIARAQPGSASFRLLSSSVEYVRAIVRFDLTLEPP